MMQVVKLERFCSIIHFYKVFCKNKNIVLKLLENYVFFEETNFSIALKKKIFQNNIKNDIIKK